MSGQRDEGAKRGDARGVEEATGNRRHSEIRGRNGTDSNSSLKFDLYIRGSYLSF
jgi:hypothetical protein